MKKIIALVMAFILATAMVLPANAQGETYVLWDAETDDGVGMHSVGFGINWGPVSEDEDLGHPAPTEGTRSYCIFTDGPQTGLFDNIVDVTGIFDTTGWEYIELDVYSQYEIVFNWDFGICTNVNDPTGACWELENAWLPAGKWVHVRMPIVEFNDGAPEPFPVDKTFIKRIKIQLTAINDCVDFETPLETFVYFDNVVATMDGAGKENELLNFDNRPDPDESSEPDVSSAPSIPDESTDISSDVSSNVSSEIKYGEIDAQKGVSSSDALMVLQYSVNKITLTDTQLLAANVDGQEGINASDALSILQYAVNKISTFPVQNK